MQSLSRDLNAFLSLPFAEKKEFAEAWLELALTRLQLRWSPQRALHGSMSEIAGRDDAALASRIATQVQRAASRHLAHPTCVPRALALLRMLRRRGIRSRLRIGGRVEEGRLVSHAWVETDGQPLNESADVEQRYPRIEVTEEAFVRWNFDSSFD